MQVQHQLQQQRQTPWMLQVPSVASDPTSATTNGASSSPNSAFSSDHSPSSAYADLAPWWSQGTMASNGAIAHPPALALDMSVLSVASTDPSPVIGTQQPAQPQHHQAQQMLSSGPLTPVSPPLAHPESTPGYSGHDASHVQASMASIPRKRSLTMATEDSLDTDDINLHFESASPVDHEGDDCLNLITGPMPGQTTSSPTKPVGAKPAISNNFVSKLYQMIVDSKSAQYIQWTEHGTSFVVSNIGEFSRAILGSHFKHSNFSSFVRQLNMYGFHKLNRTPRAQRTSPDAHVWEFSHPLFLRARPDLLEQIRRKAPEAEAALAASNGAAGPHGILTGPARRELPGDIHAALDGARQEAAQARQELEMERRRLNALANVTKQLHDVVSHAYPGLLQGSFPTDLLEGVSHAQMHSHAQQHSPMTPMSASTSIVPSHPSQMVPSDGTYTLSGNTQNLFASFTQQPLVPSVPSLPVGLAMNPNASMHPDFSVSSGRSSHSSPGSDGANTSSGMNLGWNWSSSPPSSAGGEGSMNATALPWTTTNFSHSGLGINGEPHAAKRPRIHSESAPSGVMYSLGSALGPAPGPVNGHKLSRARSDELLGAPSWSTGLALQGQAHPPAGIRHIVPSIARCGRSATPAEHF